MATLLVLVIFIAYVGLGIPDSLFGTAWPAIYQEFNLPIATQSAVTILISSGTIFSSLMSGRLINRFGTGIVTAISTTITALALLGFAFSNHLAFLCLCAVPLGLGAGAIDVAQNTYVANHYNARIMINQYYRSVPLSYQGTSVATPDSSATRTLPPEYHTAPLHKSKCSPNISHRQTGRS